jgi:hypothetical protein
LLTTLIVTMGSRPMAAETIYELNLGTVLTGLTPLGSSPWLTADFKDVGAKKVELTLTSHLVSPNDVKGGDKDNAIQGWVFNLGVDPSVFDLSQLAIINKTSNDGIFAAYVFRTEDGLKVPGGNNGFDIGFNWSEQARFVQGAVETYEIQYNGTGSFSAVDFMHTNSGGDLISAAHVQSIVTDTGTSSGAIGTSTYSTVPEPSTLAGLVSLTLAGLLMTSRWSRRRA